MPRSHKTIDDHEIRDLKSCISDLVSILALPALCAGGDTQRIIRTLLEILQRMLFLDFAYVRLPAMMGRDAIEDSRSAISDSPALAANEIGMALEPWLTAESEDSTLHSFSLGNWPEISVRLATLGHRKGMGWLVCGCTRKGFPTRNERLILEVAANQVALGIHESALLSIQKQESTRLDLLVSRRTLELQKSNEALRTEAAGRILAENLLRRSEAHLTEAQGLSRTGSFTWNLLTGKMEWSAEAYRIWELPATEEPGLAHILRLVHPEDLTAFRLALDENVRSAVDSEVEFRLLLPGARLKHVHLASRAIRDKSGCLVEFAGAVRDVTEMRNAFKEIQDLKERLHHENVVLREQVTEVGMFGQIIGTAPLFRRVLDKVTKVAPTDSTVLITGETGTGKELIARAVHENSKRASGPFLKVNCAAIPTSLIAAELFGYEKGAFTGAVQRKMGRFELANEGTLFLDEIGELPPETQIMLLRVLQEKEFERVGGSQVIQADVRIIAATNRNLAEEIAFGRFRQDLFYRLNVFPIEMPALRERKDDILRLSSYFIDLYSKKMEKRIVGISEEAQTMLKNYPWPGNIRELQNVVERSLILCDTEILTIDESWLGVSPVEAPASEGLLGRQPPDKESALIEDALGAARGRISGPRGAAAQLGIPASTLESRIRSLKIDKHRFKSA